MAFRFGRNLVHEKELEEQHANQPMAKQLPFKKRKHAEKPWKAAAAAEFDSCAGNLGNNWPDSIFIQVRDELCDDAKTNGVREELEALSIIPGPYFRLPFMHCSRPIYKQANTIGHNPAYIFYCDDQSNNSQDSGWWCSSSFWESVEERERTSAVGYMRMWHDDRSTWSWDNFCVPHWADQAALKGDIKAFTYVEYLELELTAHKDPPESYDDQNAAQNAGAARGGWLMKCAELTAAVFRRDWKEASRLAAALYEGPRSSKAWQTRPRFQSEVDKHMHIT